MVGIAGTTLMVGTVGDQPTHGMTHSTPILLGDIRVLVVGDILIQGLVIVMADLTHLIAFTRLIHIMEVVGIATLGTTDPPITFKSWTPVVVQVQITTIA